MTPVSSADQLRDDIRAALRQLARNPGLTLVAVATLALGIGATSALFSVVYCVLLRPLPYAHPERLIRLRERNGVEDTEGMAVTFGNYDTWAKSSHAFEVFGAWQNGQNLTITGYGAPVAVTATEASASYWRALQIPPVVGRYFNDDEDRQGHDRVLVLSYGLWRSRFGADRGVIGRTLDVSGIPYQIIGVASPAYALTPQAVEAPQIWIPLALTPGQQAQHTDHELAVVGVVRAGTTTESAVAELTAIETRLASEHPHAYFDGGIIARPLREYVVGPVRPMILVLFGSVTLVLLIACANIANLLLARAVVREQEMAIRSALGATPARIVRQLVAESVLLSIAGAVGGLFVASAGVSFLVHAAPVSVPRLQDVALDGPVVVFIVALMALCGVGCGLAPARRASRPDLQRVLSSGRGAAGAGIRYGVRASLVIGQVAIALMLVIGAGLMLHSAIRLRRVPPGFTTQNIVVARIALPRASYPSDTATMLAFDGVANAVSQTFGVQASGLVSLLPIASAGSDCAVQPEGAINSEDRAVTANVRMATPGLFRALGVPLISGRGLEASDRAGQSPVTVINANLARRLFGRSTPLGKHLAACDGGTTPRWYTVVGVIADVHANGIAEEAPAEAYFPLAQRPARTMTLVIRSNAPVAQLLPAVRRTLSAVVPSVPLADVSTMDDIMARSLALPRFTTALLGFLGGTGLLLALIGIYGIIAFVVAQRTREIGVRIALGATPAMVLRAVTLQGLLLSTIGVAIGLAASLVVARFLARMLFEVSVHDPLVFVGSSVLLSLIAIAASSVPAWRACRVDPLVALRSTL